MKVHKRGTFDEMGMGASVESLSRYRFFGFIAIVVIVCFTWWMSSTLQFYMTFSNFSLHKENRVPRVYVDASNWFNPTGGPEALIQLTLAFRSLLPNNTLIVFDKNKAYSSWSIDALRRMWYGQPDEEYIHPRFPEEYPEISTVPVGHIRDLVSGDILILAEISACPDILLSRGVKVYVWVLGANKKRISALHDSKCSVFSHNYWLSQNMGFNMPTNQVLRPYITPSLLPSSSLSFSLKENMILIDNDTPEDVIDNIYKICLDLECKAVLVKGFSRQELVGLFKKTKIVVDWCLRGSERMPIEAVLHGAVLLTSDCECAQDFRDFPIPKDNVIPHTTVYQPMLKTAISRVLADYNKEYEGYKAMRALYGSEISAVSLKNEVREWLDTQASTS